MEEELAKLRRIKLHERFKGRPDHPNQMIEPAPPSIDDYPQPEGQAMTREEADQLIVECEQLAGELAVIGRVEQVAFAAEMKADGFEVAGIICNNAKTMSQASDRMERLMSLSAC